MNEAMREKLVIELANRYLTHSVELNLNGDGSIEIPSEEVCINALLLVRPLEFWGDKQDLTEWARFARDEIIEGRNYRASGGRDLHDEPADPAYMYE